MPPETACEIACCIINLHLQRNSTESLQKRLAGIFYILNYCTTERRFLFWEQAELSNMLRVWERGTAGVRSGLDCAFWHDRRANAGNKSVSLTQWLSSSGIPLCPRQLPTNKDVWEENRSHHSSCQGEMHLVAVEICQKKAVRVFKSPLNFFFFFF